MHRLQATAPVTDINYAGTLYSADSGLYLAVNRIYDPITGRWISRDPIGDGGDPLGNLYGYVGGNPISLKDPLGLWVVTVSAGASSTGSVTGGFSVGLAFGSGGVAIYETTGLGVGIGAGEEAEVGLSVGGSTTGTVGELSGTSVDVSASGGEGLVGGLDVSGDASGGMSGAINVGGGGGSGIAVGTMIQQTQAYCFTCPPNTPQPPSPGGCGSP